MNDRSRKVEPPSTIIQGAHDRLDAMLARQGDEWDGRKNDDTVQAVPLDMRLPASAAAFLRAQAVAAGWAKEDVGYYLLAIVIEQLQLGLPVAEIRTAADADLIARHATQQLAAVD